MKQLIISSLLIIYASLLYAQTYMSSRDSAIQFLKGIGESDTLIDKLIEYGEDIEYETTFHLYVFMDGRYHYDDTILCVNFTWFEKNINYMCEKIVQDTITSFLWAMQPSVNWSQQMQDSFSIYSRYAMDHYNSLEGESAYLRVCTNAYSNDTVSVLHKCELLYAFMAEYVLSGYCKNFRYDERFCTECNNNDVRCFPYNTKWWRNDKEWMRSCINCFDRNDRENGINNPYNKYLSVVVDKIKFSNRRLYIFSQEEKETILKILDEGIYQGSRECAYTKAFALITGLVLDKDIALGKKLLIELMPSMSDSPFWEYVGNDANNRKGNELEKKY